MSPFEPRLKMATNTPSERKASEFDDVPLDSDSVSSDGSYDFADDNGSEDCFIVTKQEAPPTDSTPLIPTVAAESSVNASKDEQEKKTAEWLQESQKTAGDSEVSSVISDDNDDSMPSLVAVSRHGDVLKVKDYYSQDEIHPGDKVATLWASKPRASDEFALELGDMLKVVSIWDDGWATGVMIDERAEDWDPKRNAQRDSGVSNTSGRRDESPAASGEIKAFPLVCVCLPDHWRKTIEGDGPTETGSSVDPNDWRQNAVKKARERLDNLKMAEQLKAAEAKIVALEAAYKAESAERFIKEEVLRSEAEGAKTTIAKLEKELRQVKEENSNERFENERLKTKIERYDAVIEVCTEFLDGYLDKGEVFDNLEKLANEYADGVLSGDKPDKQEVWDKLLTNMGQNIKGLDKLWWSLMAKLDKLADQVDAENGEFDKEDGEEGGEEDGEEDGGKVESADSCSLDYRSSCSRPCLSPSNELNDRDEEVEHLRNSLEATLEDNSKLSATIANLANTLRSTYMGFNNQIKTHEEVEQLRNSLEAHLEDNSKLSGNIANIATMLSWTYMGSHVTTLRHKIDALSEENRFLVAKLNNKHNIL